MHQAREIQADGQAQSCAPAAGRRVRLIEGVEDPREILGIDSRSCVLDGDGDDVPVSGDRAGTRRERRSVRRR